MAQANQKDRASTATATSSNVIEAWFTQGKANFEKLSQNYGGPAQADAWAASADIVIKGCTEMFESWSSLVQGATERNSRAAQALFGQRDFKDIAETQSRLVQETVNDLLGGLTALSELSVRVTTQALEPLSAQTTGPARKAGKAA